MDEPEYVSEKIEEGTGYGELAMVLDEVRNRLKEIKKVRESSEKKMKQLVENVNELKTIVQKKAVFDEE